MEDQFLPYIKKIKEGPTPAEPVVEKVIVKKEYKIKKKFFLGIGIAIISGIAVWGGLILKQNFTREVTPEEVLVEVGKLVQLPADEMPTIATITDLAQLKNQEFFKEAKAGDKVLIFSKSKKAILYRPSENKIIEIAPISS